MKTIENLKESGTTVIMDDKYFSKCEFTECTLIYNGGDFGWNDSTIKDCRLVFNGPASRMMEYAKHFNLLKDSPPQKNQRRK